MFFIFNGVSPTVEALLLPVKLFHRLPSSLAVVNNLLFLKNYPVSVGYCSLCGIYCVSKALHYCLSDRLNIFRVCHYSIIIAVNRSFLHTRFGRKSWLLDHVSKPKLAVLMTNLCLLKIEKFGNTYHCCL